MKDKEPDKKSDQTSESTVYYGGQAGGAMSDYARSVAHENAADLAISWLETIRLETLRTEPDCAERVQTLLNAAAHHIRIREAMQTQYGKQQTAVEHSLLQEAINTLQWARVFVTTKEKAKHPEGTQLYDEVIARISDFLSDAEQSSV